MAAITRVDLARCKEFVRGLGNPLGLEIGSEVLGPSIIGAPMRVGLTRA